MFLADDALFYPQVAYNIVRTGSSTFNTITPTNGYHPLWMLLNVAAMGLAGHHRMAGLHITLAIEVVLLLVAVYAYRRWMDAMGFQRGLLGISVIIGVVCSSFWGMESHLTVLFVVLCGWQFMRLHEHSSRGSWLLFGILLGGMILSRLDDVFVAFALILFAAFGRRLEVFAKHLLLAGIPCCLLLIPYLIFNKVTFGHPMPVSGAIKSCFPHISGNLNNIGPLGKLSAVFAILGIGLTLMGETSTRGIRLIRALSLGILAQLAYTVLFTNDPSTRSFWYYATATLNCALVLDFATETFRSRLTARKGIHLLQAAVASCSLLIALSGVTRSWLKLRGVNANPMNSIAVGHVESGPHERFEEQLAHWITTSLPPDARILTVDFPGRIAFLSNANVVPLDGLISDYKYNDEITQKGIGEFISRTHLAYYIGPICDSGTPCRYSYFLMSLPTPNQGQQVEIRSPLYRVAAGSFHLEKKDLMLDLNQAFGTTLGHGHLGVWRIEQ
jgi:hypothetical protein